MPISERLRRLLGASGWIAVAAAPCLIAWIAWRYGARVPLAEQLESVFAMKTFLLEHRFSWDPIFWKQPGSDHIVFFPLLVDLFWAVTTRWNIGLQLIWAPVLALLDLSLLLYLSRSLPGYEKSYRLLLPAILLSLLFFSSRQWEVWIWSMNYLFYFIPFCCLAAVTLVARYPRSRRAFLAAALLCLIATFSFGNGILTWIGVLPLLLVDARNRHDWRRAAVWTVLFLLCLWVYVSRYAPSPAIAHLSPADPATWRRWLQMIEVIWGQLLSPYWAFHLGRVIVVLTVALCVELWCRRGQSRNAAIWTGIILFVALSTQLVAISRAALGVSYALESRYAALMAVGLAVPALLLLRRMSRPAQAACLLLVLVFWVQNFPEDMKNMKYRHELVVRGSACLRTYESAPDDCLGILYFGHGAFVRDQADVLKALGYLPR